MLNRKVHELEEKVSQHETELSALQNEHDHTFTEVKMKQQADENEIITLQKACEMQKEGLETLTQENDDLENVRQDLIENHKQEILQQEESFKQELLQQEEAFNEEKATLKERLHEVI